MKSKSFILLLLTILTLSCHKENLIVKPDNVDTTLKPDNVTLTKYNWVKYGTEGFYLNEMFIGQFTDTTNLSFNDNKTCKFSYQNIKLSDSIMRTPPPVKKVIYTSGQYTVNYSLTKDSLIFYDTSNGNSAVLNRWSTNYNTVTTLVTARFKILKLTTDSLVISQGGFFIDRYKSK